MTEHRLTTILSFVPGLILLSMAWPAHATSELEFARQRAALVKVIERDVEETSLYLDKQALDPRVMEAMATVPRHKFVPESQRSYAYRNRPLPIGHGQTISQPYIVAIMTDLVRPDLNDRILEVGTGSGYQAAVLSKLVGHVYTIEIIRPLAERARAVVKALGYKNVDIKLGDGYYGWKEHAPFDAIVVTAAASQIPPPLIQQLKPGGRMIIPLGSRFMVQQLVLVEKDKQDKITTKQILPVRFVPLTGGH